jgi:uncharacterized membrane protein
MVAQKRVGLGIVFVWFFIGGIAHFALTDFFVLIVPTWVAWPSAVVYVSGVFELLGAVGVLVARYRRLAGLGLCLLTLAVTPANVYMWLNPEKFPSIPEPLLAIRLPVQVALLWCIWWSTRQGGGSRRPEEERSGC